MKGIPVKVAVRMPLQERTRVDGSSQIAERQCRWLTNRENDVIRCFAKGLLYKETAEELKISYSAVHKHQHKAFLKLRAGNRSEAIRKWWDIGCR